MLRICQMEADDTELNLLMQRYKIHYETLFFPKYEVNVSAAQSSKTELFYDKDIIIDKGVDYCGKLLLLEHVLMTSTIRKLVFQAW